MDDPASTDDDAYGISVACTQPDAQVDTDAIAQAVRVTLAAHAQPAANISIALVDDAAMADLHGRYLDDPTPTDVLTFDLADEADGGIEGEIVISVDTARRECAQRGHSLNHEITLYAVHGTLHLLGYDDQTPADAQRMHTRENELLAAIGIGPVFGEIEI